MAVAEQRVNNLQKAAILLASLPQDEAVKLLERLDDDQAKSVAIEMANLGRISADVQKSVFTEFENADPNAFGGERGGRDKAMDLLTKAKSGSKRVIDDVKQSIDAQPFGFLRRIDAQNVLTCRRKPELKLSPACRAIANSPSSAASPTWAKRILR
jgi:flagellar motor switch protein FliG